MRTIVIPCLADYELIAVASILGLCFLTWKSLHIQRSIQLKRKWISLSNQSKCSLLAFVLVFLGSHLQRYLKGATSVTMSCLSIKHPISGTIFSHLLLIFFNNRMIDADFSQHFFKPAEREVCPPLHPLPASSTILIQRHREHRLENLDEFGLQVCFSLNHYKKSSRSLHVLIGKPVNRSVAIAICLTVNFTFAPRSCSRC